MRRRLILTLAGIALVAAGLGVAYATAQRASAGDGEDVAVIRAFMNRPDLTVMERATPPSAASRTERAYSTADGRTSFVVDPQYRMVVNANLGYDKPGDRGDVGRDRALQAAQTFAASRVADFGKLTLIKDELLDHGAGGREYSFEWGEQLGSQKALGLRLVSISVNAASGTIGSFVQVPPVPVTVSPEPSVTHDQALAIAKQHFGAQVTASTTRLSVWWRNNDRTQKQVLRWTVTLASNEPIGGSTTITKHAAYIIDAHTGEILEVMN